MPGLGQGLVCRTLFRTAFHLTVVMVGLILPDRLRAAEPSQVEIDFKPVHGLPVVELVTSQGKIRLVVDTASNFTSLLRPPNWIKVRLARQEILLHPAPIQTPEFSSLNATLPAADQVDGLLGEDFFAQFESVRFDFLRHKLCLILLPNPAARQAPRTLAQRRSIE